MKISVDFLISGDIITHNILTLLIAKAWEEREYEIAENGVTGVGCGP